MGRNRRGGGRQRHWPRKLRTALVAALGVGIAFALGGGARADRTAAASAPSLESLLERRKALERPAPPPPAPESLQGRHDELRRRRAEIEGNLPPALRTPRSRRPELREPPRDLAGRRAVVAFDGAGDNPDRVAFQVPR
jgi:hypothetical protein